MSAPGDDFDDLLVALAPLVDAFARRVADHLREPAAPQTPPQGRWLTTAQAADYLGCHRDTVRKLVAQRAIPCEQDAPGCKLYFRAADLDQWRAAGERPAHRGRAA